MLAIAMLIAGLTPGVHTLARAETPAAPALTPQQPSSASGIDETCRKYVPSVGKIVTVPCEVSQQAAKGGDVNARLPMGQIKLSATVGQLPGGDGPPRGYLGTSVSDLTPALAKLLDLGGQKGAVVLNVAGDAPGARAGLRIGDVALSVNGRRVETAAGFAQAIQSVAPGGEATIEIARHGEAGDLMRSVRDRADAGSRDAMMALGGLLLNNDATGEAEALNWYRKAAEAGDPQGMSNVGSMYFNGRGVAKDEREAARWFRKAMEAGDMQAAALLAFQYGNGQGVPKDEREAARLYRKGAEEGEPQAMLDLGIVYQAGLGVPKDFAEAAYWFRKSAEAGNSAAMANLGTLYHNGAGVEKDAQQAAAWMFQSLQNGSAAAVEALTANRDAYSSEFRRALQGHLKEAGVFDGEVDGKFGPATLRAFKELAGRAPQ